jgi:hypothetical protein
MPNIRQFVYTALNTRLAAESLAYINISGFMDVFEICKPKYLNCYTVLISYLLTYIYSLQLTNIAFVLPMLISRSLLSQKRLKQFTRCYNSRGDGAIRTKSSAKANMNNYREAIVYACLLLLLMPCLL